MGYAFKLIRVSLLILTGLFDIWGFVGGLIGLGILLGTTKPLFGTGYFYPLIPFNAKALRRLFLRVPISPDNT